MLPTYSYILPIFVQSNCSHTHIHIYIVCVCIYIYIWFLIFSYFSYMLPIFVHWNCWFLRSLPSWALCSWECWWAFWWPWVSVWSSSSTSPRGRRSPFCGASQGPPSISTWSRNPVAPSSRHSVWLMAIGGAPNKWSSFRSAKNQCFFSAKADSVIFMIFVQVTAGKCGV